MQCVYKYKMTRKTPIYYCFNVDNIKIVNVVCYELTNVFDRGILAMLDFDILMASVLNKDTNYFSSIIESYSRDAYAFIVQSNVNGYGDSRIRQPTKTEVADLVKLKGGLNNYIVCAKLDILTLKKHKKMLLDYIVKTRKRTKRKASLKRDDFKHPFREK